MKCHETLFFLLVCVHLCSAAGEYYVTAPEGSPCPANTTCHNLSYYTSEPSSYFTNNTIFYILEGTHSLEQEELVVITSVTNLTLQGLTKSKDLNKVRIVCLKNNEGGFNISNSSGIELKKFSIFQCGKKNLVELSGALIFFHVKELTVSYLTITKCRQFGMAVLSSSSVKISHSNFSRNSRTHSPTIYSNRDNFINDLHVIGANLLIAMLNMSHVSESTKQVTIDHTNISNGKSLGLLVIFEQKDYTAKVTLSSLCVEGNTGTNIAIVAHSNRYIMSILSVMSKLASSANQKCVAPKAKGGGLKFLHLENNGTSTTHGILLIKNSNFLENCAARAAGMLLSWSENATASATIDSCIIANNIALQSPGVYINYEEAFNSIIHPRITIINLTITGSESSLNTSAMTIYSMQNITLTNINISNNNCTGILAINSQVEIRGSQNVIHNNNGSMGGGLALYDKTYLLLGIDSQINFSCNHALDIGGAMFIEALPSFFIFSEASCFLQLTDTDSGYHDLLSFSNNTAGITGSILFGGESCIRTNLFEYIRNSSRSYYEESPIAPISSNPIKICFCDNKICLNETNISDSAFPGQIIAGKILALSRWDTLTIAKAIVYNATKNDEDFEVIDTVKTIDINDAQCTPIDYTFTAHMHENLTTAYLLIYLDSESTPLLGTSNQLTVEITVLDCPLGFSLSNETHTCTCAPYLTQELYNITCNISDKSFQRTSNSWFGNISLCATFPHRCPADYCQLGTVNFKLENTDPQCALNRTGVLCGQCEPNLSLVLGSNKCTDCSNHNLYLILPFAIVGAALVLLLAALNLTVSVGTISGFIYFANVMKIYKLVASTNGSIPFLSQFIYWLNLELGIETCFFNGMNTCTKSLLQFAFPIYIISLAVVLHLLTYCSKKVDQMFSGITIPVIATCLLLSYTSMLENVIKILSFVRLDCHGRPNVATVWLIDGNYAYFTECHAVLSVIAILILVTFIIPYTFLLTVFSLLERYIAKVKMLKFILVLKPLFDAYAAPFGIRRGFWPGLLLWVRLIMIVVKRFTHNPTVSSTLLECTSSILAIILLRYKIYARDELNFFNAILVQLMITLILSLAKQVLPKSSTQQQVSEEFITIITTIALSMIVVTFIVIILIQIHSVFYKYRNCKLVKSKHAFVMTDDASSLVKSIQASSITEDLLGTVKEVSMNDAEFVLSKSARIRAVTEVTGQ